MNGYYLLIITSFLFSVSFSSGIPLEEFISKRERALFLKKYGPLHKQKIKHKKQGKGA
jgi:hypothetical protein